MQKNTFIARFFPVIAFVLLFCFLCGAEYLYANRLRHEVLSFEEKILDLSSAEVQGGAFHTANGIKLRSGSSVIFYDVNTEIADVALTASSNDFFISEFTVSTKDDASKEGYRTYVDGRLYTDEAPTYFHVRSSDQVRTLRLQCTSGEPLYLTSVTLNSPPAVSFSVFRVFAVFFLLLFLYLVWRFRLWKVVYDRNRLSHRYILLGVLFVCLFVFCACGTGVGLKEIPYADTENLNAYEQLFVSLLDGRLHIDVDCDPALLEALENPYDFTERNTLLETYGPFWDRAYYEGNFYCYFGIAPVLLFFFPIYFLTGMAPNLTLVVLLLSLIGTAALFGALLKMIRYFKLRVPFLALCIGFPVLSLSSLLPMIAVSADMYYTACAAGLAFVALTLCLAFSALCTEHPIGRRLLFAGAGISLALTLASRPTVVLYAAVLIPPFLAVLFERGRKALPKAIDAASFLVPLVICVLPVLLYNQLRFDSPFEFGATYQMTFSDISYNRLSFALLGETVMHYFLQMPSLAGQFPYLRPSYLALDSYGVYFYSAYSIGAMAFPLAWAGFAQGFTTKKQPVKKAVWMLLLALPFAVAFADLCLGGVNIRYLTDIMLPLVLLGLLVMLELLSKANDRFSESTSYRFFCVCFAVLLLTAYLSFALIFANERDNIYKTSPAVFRFFATIFS